MVLRQAGRADFGEVSETAIPTSAIHLFVSLQELPDRRSLYASVVHGFPADPKVADIPDEYMYGPAFLVAPVTEQGATHRTVYLPAGCDWYNYWTNERLHGGQTILADAPIDTLPLFVRAGSIVPLGSEVESTQQAQTIASVRVYPGANGSFTHFEDDGKTYGYEKDGGSITTLTWDDAAHQFTHEGGAASSELDKATVVVIGK